jgi:hypothetical protein
VAGPTVASHKRLEATLADKQKKSKSPMKDLAQAESKRVKLFELLDNRGLDVVQLKSDKTGAVAEVNLLKKLHKTEVKSKKELAKKELEAKCAVIKGHEVANRLAKKELDWQKRQYETLAKVHSNLVARNSELAASLVDVVAVKTKLLATTKIQA